MFSFICFNLSLLTMIKMPQLEHQRAARRRRNELPKDLVNSPSREETFIQKLSHRNFHIETLKDLVNQKLSYRVKGTVNDTVTRFGMALVDGRVLAFGGTGGIDPLDR